MRSMFTYVTLLLSLCMVQQNFAAAPTKPSYDIKFGSGEGNRIYLYFSIGNGTERIIVVRPGAPVAGTPVKGATYKGNSSFGTPGTEFTVAGEYVVAAGNVNNITVTNLLPNTTYHFAIFEYNGTGTATEYLLTPGTADRATVATPTKQAGKAVFSSITGNSMKLDWEKGDGAQRIVVLRKDNPVNSDPVDLSSYSANAAFGSGSTVGAGNYVVYSNTGNTISISNLEPNTTYHAAIYEFNGQVFPMYLKPALTASAKTAAGPSLPPTNLNFTGVDGNRLIIGFTNGNGTKRLVVGKAGNAVTFQPENGKTYKANTEFGTPDTEILPGEFVLKNDGSNYFTVSKLQPNTRYHFAVFEYDESSTTTYYLTSPFAFGDTNTAATPSAPTGAITISEITGTTARISCVAGGGKYRLIVAREGNPVNAAPADLIKYNASANFGDQVMSGDNYALSSWETTTLTVNKLKPATTYHVSIFEYNGTNYPIYLPSGTTASFTTVSEPTNTGTFVRFNSIEGNQFEPFWIRGNGARRIVIARKGEAVSARPQDGVNYTAVSQFGDARSEIKTGEYVVYDGDNNSFTLSGLDHSTSYHLAIFEYNTTPAGVKDYLISSFVTANTATLSIPTEQSKSLNMINIQDNQATVSFAKGNGSGRLVVMRESSTPANDPVNFVRYSSGAYGNSSSVTGAGNYVVFYTTNASTTTGLVTGLKPATTYTATIYEYNGDSGPVYLTPGLATTFTTTGTPPLTAPVTPATLGVVSNTEGSSLKLSWKKGDGGKRIVVMKQGGNPAFTPADNANYTPNSSFSSGVNLGDGQYVVYNDNGDNVTVTNLQPNTTYNAAVYEYNTNGTGYRYLTSSKLFISAPAAATPTGGASSFNSLATENSATLSWTNGTGRARLVVAKEESAIGSNPVDLTQYQGISVFRSGQQIEPGAYVVYAGENNSVTVTGLSPRKKYHFSVFEYNGTTAPVYNTTNVLTGTAITLGSLPVTWQYFTAQEKNNAVVLKWATAQESNTAFFAVERSTDGILYTTLTTLAAAGNSNQPSYYSYTDQQLPAGTNHYRIRQVDIDNRFSYSTTVSLKLSAPAAALKVYPNPITGQATISWQAEAGRVTLQVYDATGKLIRVQHISNGQTVNMQQLQPGIYHLVISTGKEQFNASVIRN